MKIISRMLAVGLAISFATPIKPVKSAVPIVIAPVVCTKVCVLLGTAVVGGITSYVWHNRTAKKKYFADEKGNVRKMLDDPDEFEQEQVIGSYPAESKGEAVDKCKFLAAKQDMNYVEIRTKGKNLYECIAKPRA